jgi:hypothetical protein
MSTANADRIRLASIGKSSNAGGLNIDEIKQVLGLTSKSKYTRKQLEIMLKEKLGTHASVAGTAVFASPSEEEAIKEFQIRNAARIAKIEKAWKKDTADLRREPIVKLREMVLEKRLRVIRDLLCKKPFDGKSGFGLYIKNNVLDRDRFISKFKLQENAHLSDSKLQDIVIQQRMLEHKKLCDIKTIADLIKQEGDLKTLSKEELIEYLKPMDM